LVTRDRVLRNARLLEQISPGLNRYFPGWFE
jgi:hypothetical protein